MTSRPQVPECPSPAPPGAAPRGGARARGRVVALAAALATALLCTLAPAAWAGSYLVFVDDESGFTSSLQNSPTSTIVDTGGAFAPDPSAATGLTSVTRSGSIGGQSYSFTVYDVNFTTATTPAGTISPGTAGGDVSSLSGIDVETPVAQGGATGDGSFGYDSSSGSPSSRNAILVDFTTTPGGVGIGHFALDLVDFEAFAGGTEGWLRLYDGGVLVFSQAFSFPDAGGDGEIRFLGVVAADTSSFFDQVVLVVGDDDAGGTGSAETWAADRLRFGAAHNPEPGTLALFGVGLAGLAVVARRRRRAAGAAAPPATPDGRTGPAAPGSSVRGIVGRTPSDSPGATRLTDADGPARDLADLEDRIRDSLGWIARDDGALAAVRPSVSSWSPRMQIDHAAIATAAICAVTEKILAGSAECVAAGATAPPLAMILSTGSIPRGRADTPGSMRPETGADSADVAAHLRACADRVRALEPRAAEIAAAELRMPHFALGPMTAAQWLRFARIHFDHHLAIAREAAAAVR